MNLQQMRDFVRAQLDLDDNDLPDVLIDPYFQEGYDRVLELEQRWPFFEFEWEISYDANGRAQMPVDARHIEMMISPDGRLLPRMNARLAVLSFPPGQGTTGNPTYWTRLNRGLQLLPTPTALTTCHAIGYRMGADWVFAGGECDCDRRLHMSVCWYACSLGYAQQEDEVLEQTYLNRFKEASAQARDIIMRPNPLLPKQVAYTHYPKAVGYPGGPAQLILDVSGTDG